MYLLPLTKNLLTLRNMQFELVFSWSVNYIFTEQIIALIPITMYIVGTKNNHEQIKRGDRGSGPPWKTTNCMSFYRKCRTPSETLENYSFL